MGTLSLTHTLWLAYPQVWLVDVATLPSMPTLVRRREELVEYYMDHAHDRFYVLTNLGVDAEYKV